MGYTDQYEGFDAKMPSEWESWLRHRREAPPTDEQIMASMALAEMKKRNAAKLEQEREQEFIAEVHCVRFCAEPGFWNI